MSQHIDRHKAIEAIKSITSSMSVCVNSDECHGMQRMQRQAVIELTNLPSSEEESFEWCTDCKEYDQEKHCCHRWTKVIRNTVEELRVVRCKDCKYAEYMDDVQSLWCTECGNGRTVAPYDFCSYGERRTDG